MRQKSIPALAVLPDYEISAYFGILERNIELQMLIKLVSSLKVLHYVV